MKSILYSLLEEAFADSVGFILPPAPLRLVLQKSAVVQRIAKSLRQGAITEQMVRAFVSDATTMYQKDRWHPADLALAAIAVAVEQLPASYAEEYLCDLARLQLKELNTSIRIARECLKARLALPRNEIRAFQYPGPKSDPSRIVVSKTLQLHDRVRQFRRCQKYSEAV